MKKAKTILLISAFLLTFIVTKQLNVMQDTEEIWKSIDGYPGHQVSNLGRIRSIDHTTSHPKYGQYKVKGKIRKTYPNHRGYEMVQLKHRHRTMAVHRIVASAFIPNPNNLPEVNHIDCNKKNNSCSNLEWCTRIHNALHAQENGLLRAPSGVGHWNSKLDELQVRTIKSILSEGNITAYKIAKYFKVSYTVIHSIKHGVNWVNI